MKKGTRYHNSIWEDGVHLRWTAVHGQVKINELTLSGRRIKVKTVINTIKSQTLFDFLIITPHGYDNHRYIFVIILLIDNQ